MSVYAFNRSTAANSDYIVYNLFLYPLPSDFESTSSFRTVDEAVAFVRSLLPPDLLAAPIRANLSALVNAPYTTGQLFNLINYAVVDEGQTLQNSTVYSSVSFGGVSASATNAQLRVAVDNTQYQNCPAFVAYLLTITDNYESGSIYYQAFPKTLLTNGQIDSTNISTSDKMGRYTITYDFNTSSSTYSVTVKFESFNFNSNAIASIARLDGVQLVPFVENSDPYTGAGYSPSTAGGGLSSGSFNFTDNGLTNVNTPGIDLLGSGFLTAWNVNKVQLNALANWLWVTTPSQIFQQIYGNPINAVIGLNVVPVAPSIDSGSNTIKFGVEDSQIAAPKITSQYVSVDCGTLTIAPIYGSYMDYGPYSSAELFLPYCGGVPLDINDVVGKTISIKYQVDILSGACVAYIFIDGHLHYQRSGCCAGTAPVTGSQLPNVISGVLSIVGSVAGAIGSMGASGASTAAKVASGIATGTDVASAATNALKRSISYSGTVSGWSGLLGAQKPYLILSLPNAAIPAGQQQLAGYPAWVGGQLSGFSGHTECANVHLNGLRATDEEMAEIRSLLESGVIL
jgi:hypothetical protein